MKYLVVLLILLYSTFTQANIDHEFTIKFGGWSHHNEGITKKLINKYYDENFEYNESHNGLGLEYATKINSWGSNHYFTAGAWYMKDSYYEPAYHIGIGYKYRLWTRHLPFESIDFNVSLTHFDRSAMFAKNRYEMVSAGTNGNPPEVLYYKDFEVRRVNFTIPYPYITFNVTERFNFDLMALIAKSSMRELENNKIIDVSEWESVLFFRLGYKF